MEALQEGIGGLSVAASPIVTECSKEGAVCPICEEPIALGSPIFPCAKLDSLASLLWAHDRCAKESDPKQWIAPPVCRHWRRGGKCPYMEKALCAFAHPEEERGKGELDTGKRSWGGKRRRLR